MLNEEGTYRIYDLQGEYQQYSLGSEATELGIADARIYENGLVALTNSLTLVEAKGWQGERPLVLANPGGLLIVFIRVLKCCRPLCTSALMGCHPS